MRRSLWPLVSSLAFALLANGCEKADPNSSAYWIQKIGTEDRRQAIQKLGEMKAQDAVQPLMEAYKENRHRAQIITALSQIGDKAATPTMLEALKDTTEPKSGQLAAATLLDWGEVNHADVFVPVLSNKATPKETLYGVLKILAESPDPRATSVLLEILTGDPDLQPITLNGLAAEALGKLKEPKAIDGLISCLWLDDHLGRNEVPNCRLALNRIGPQAVPALIQALERKNRGVEKRAHKFKFDKGGLIEAKAAEVLIDFAPAEAVEPLLAALKRTETMPVEFQQKPDKANAFVMSGVQKVISISTALAAIGDERAVEPLLAIAGSKELALEHKMAATQQLAFLGSTKALPGLIKLLDDEPHQNDPVSQGFRIQLALAVTNLLDGSSADLMKKVEAKLKAIRDKMPKYAADKKPDVAKAQAKIKEIDDLIAEDEKDLTTEANRAKLRAHKEEKEQWKNALNQYNADIKAYDDWAKEYDNMLTKIEALRECTDNAACWGNKLADEKSTVRMMAAYRLAQSKDPQAAVPELIKHVNTEDLTLRNVIFFGLNRLGDHSIIPELEKLRAADVERAAKKKEFQGAIYTIDLMLAKLSHR